MTILPKKTKFFLCVWIFAWKINSVSALPKMNSQIKWGADREFGSDDNII